MPINVIDNLRQDINDKHQEALKALDTIAVYLQSAPPTSNGQSPITQKATITRRPRRSSAGSLRARVIAAFQTTRTVRSVADELQLAPKQVRGVVGSPDLRANFLPKGDVEGVMTYLYSKEIES